MEQELNVNEQLAMLIKARSKKRVIILNTISLLLAIVIGWSLNRYWPNAHEAKGVACIGFGVSTLLIMSAPTFIEAGKIMKEARLLKENDLLTLFSKRLDHFSCFSAIIALTLTIIGSFMEV